MSAPLGTFSERDLYDYSQSHQDSSDNKQFSASGGRVYVNAGDNDFHETKSVDSHVHRFASLDLELEAAVNFRIVLKTESIIDRLIRDIDIFAKDPIQSHPYTLELHESLIAFYQESYLTVPQLIAAIEPLNRTYIRRKVTNRDFQIRVENITSSIFHVACLQVEANKSSCACLARYCVIL